MPQIISATHIRITKRAALLGQLRQAILLYLEGEDHASVTTLAGAATQLAADLLTAAGTPSPFPVRTGWAVKPEMQKSEEWRVARAKLKRPEGFFKHADKKGENTLEAEIELQPAQIELLLFEACLGAQQLGIRDHVIDVFSSYFGMVLHPDLVDVAKMPKDVRAAWEACAKEFSGIPRSEFAKYLRALPRPVLYTPVLNKAGDDPAIPGSQGEA